MMVLKNKKKTGRLDICYVWGLIKQFSQPKSEYYG